MNFCLLCNHDFLIKYELKEILSFAKLKRSYICPNCRIGFEKIGQQYCHGCMGKSQNKICDDCLRWQQVYGDNILKNTAVYRYNMAFHDLMVSYKRYGDYELYQVLAELVADKLKKMKADYYVPVPTSFDHQKRRQFDTISSIYEQLVPLTKVLEKHGHEAQGEKNRRERLLTAQTFNVIQDCQVKLSGKILLLDDIYTTGRTLYHARDAIMKISSNCTIESFTIVH